MIVLDEQLLGRDVEGQIAQWYRGAVCFITDLRPNTVIKDDVIPKLLQQERHLCHDQRTGFLAQSPDQQTILYRVLCLARRASARNSTAAETAI